MSSTKKFAVVMFPTEDNCTSEIPTSWILPDSNYCYWPKCRNATQLMQNDVPPDPQQWTICEIKVLCYCDTLTSARKRATSTDYTSSEEIGRGKRRKRVIEREPETSSSDNDETGTPPPYLPLELGDWEKTIQNCEIISIPFPTAASDINTSSASTVTVTSNDTSTHSNSNASSTVINNISPAEFHTLEKKVSTILQYVKSLSDKFGGGTSTNVNHAPLERWLPLKTAEELNTFDEELLLDKDTMDIFKHYISTIGGKNPKDNLFRVLKKVYTNELGTECSWLGLRGNIKISGRPSTNAIKGVVLNANAGTKEVDFEKGMSEWFRLSKLRLKRQTATV